MDKKDNKFCTDSHGQGSDLLEYSLNMFPEILACVRQGDRIALREEIKQINFRAYYSQALPALEKLRGYFLVQVGAIMVIAWQGGLPMDRMAAVSKKYLQASGSLNTTEEYTDLTIHMLFEFTEEVHACPKFDSGNAIVDACRTYIHAHVHDRINFYDLAKTCGFSLDWIQHMYHRHTGETLTDSVRKVKIEKAKYYLEYSELTGAEISERLSFCSQSYFIAQFRKETGMTPNKFRRQNTPVHRQGL
ncbi:MAG: AraC family transcriptional regulator [Clostridia bacterium]|nr:AraC family transcriptional regulator [Clostridia bacterium]